MREFLYRRAAPILPPALLSYALAWSLHIVLFTPQAWFVRALWTLLFTIAFALWMRSWKTFLAGGALASAAVFILWLVYRPAMWPAVGDFLGRTFAFIGGGDDMQSRHVLPLALCSTALCCLAVSFFARLRRSFAPLLALTAGLLLTEWLIGHFRILPVLIPAVTALLMLMTRSFQHQSGRERGIALPADPMALWTLPIALIISLAAYIGLLGRDTGQWKWDWLVDRAEVVSDYLSEYTGLTRPRTAFSLSKTGFSPYGGRLGGPVDPDDTQVLWVAADRPVLLRGNTYNSYESTRWSDTTGSKRYRVSSMSDQREIFEDVFDLGRPTVPGLTDADLSSFMIGTDVTVVHLTDGTSSMFTPFRVGMLTLTKRFDMIVCYNDKGDMFSTRGVETGSGYAIHAHLPDYRDPGFPRLMARLLAEANPDPYEKISVIRDLYAGLPESISPEVYETVARVTEPAENDYEKMALIRDYLSTGFTYTLRPKIPPDSDFVSHFLESGEGYCTYYASAMAVMARIAGLPSRYVEGYLAVPNASRECTVTNRRAHAWAEVYFDGIGWIPFDATPLPGDPGSGGPVTGPPDGELFPTPGPTAAPEPSGGVTPPVRMNAKAVLTAAALAVLGLLALAAAGVVAASRLRTSPRVLRARRPDPEARIRFLFNDILSLLLFFYTPVKTGETLYSYATRIDRWLSLGKGSLREVAEIIVRMTYSGRPPAPADEAAVAGFRRLLARYALRAAGPFRYFRDRVVRMPWKDRWP